MKKVFSFVLVLMVLMTSALTVSAAENVADGYTRYEGESGNIVGSNAPNGLGTDTGEQFSNGSAAGYLDVSRCMFGDLDATFSNTAHVELKVTADADGAAEVVVGYTCAEDADYIAIKANDSTPVKVALKSAAAKSTATIDLKKGENIIYVSTTLLDDAGVQHGWVNIDFVDVKNATTANTAVATAGETEVPKTGETTQFVALFAAGAACLFLAFATNKKARNNILN